MNIQRRERLETIAMYIAAIVSVFLLVLAYMSVGGDP
jgi:hypothetical protein